MANSVALLHFGTPNSVEVEVVEYPAEKFPELAASLHQPHDDTINATITCIRVWFQDRRVQTLKSLLEEKEEQLQEARWKEESHAEVLQDWTAQMKELEKENEDLQGQAAMARKALQEQAEGAERYRESLQAGQKNLEIGLDTSRRIVANVELERSVLLRKVDELTSQNQELARAFLSQRGRRLSMDEDAQSEEPPDRPGSDLPSRLENETLRTSLSHAQRMIQDLRTNIHREKTEKLELKRLLQDARDQLEPECSAVDNAGLTRGDPSIRSTFGSGTD
ncbi:hypothetical protein QC762_706250 [Podospora pseudocomata]|uniref:Uncharacterized protein n=1 Tax=Podospora pseudocomata TaxID=2093779 RepID=A0ABR0G3J8_9PEZI|nr:hypothetical protein QC762_706250 [Podospora pseudocomata]